MLGLRLQLLSKIRLNTTNRTLSTSFTSTYTPVICVSAIKSVISDNSTCRRTFFSFSHFYAPTADQKQRDFKIDPNPEEKEKRENLQQQAKAAGNIQKYLRMFFLKVHPDFYQKLPDVQKVNQESMQTLNALIDIIKLDKRKQSNQTAFLHKMPQEAVLRFIFPEEGSTTMNEAHVTLDLDTSQLISVHEKQNLLEDRILDGIYSLFLQTGIAIPENERWDSESAKRWANPTPKRMKWVESELGGKQGREAVLKFVKDYLNFERRDTNQLKAEMRNEKTGAEISLDKEIIFYTPSLTNEQKERGLNKLEQVKQQVQEAVKVSWVDLPILFTKANQWKVAKMDSYLVIPWNFEKDSLIEYIKLNLEKVRKARDQIREQILHIAKVRKDVIRAYQLNNVGVHSRVPTSETTECLDRLMQVPIITKLSKYNLSELNLYIGEKYNVRNASFAIEIPSNFKVDELMSFLDGVNLHSLRSGFYMSRVHQQKIKEHLDIIKSKLKFDRVQLSSKIYPLLNKSEQLKMLEQIAGKLVATRRLLKFPKNLTVIIGDTFRLNNNILEIPYDLQMEELRIMVRHKRQAIEHLQNLREDAKSQEEDESNRKELLEYIAEYRQKEIEFEKEHAETEAMKIGSKAWRQAKAERQKEERKRALKQTLTEALGDTMLRNLTRVKNPLMTAKAENPGELPEPPPKHYAPITPIDFEVRTYSSIQNKLEKKKKEE